MKGICFVSWRVEMKNCTKIQTVIQLILTIFITGWKNQS